MRCTKCLLKFKNLKGRTTCFNCENGLELYCNDNYYSASRDRRTQEGLLYSIYQGQKSSSRKRGHVGPLYSLVDLIEWCMNQEIYHELFGAWQNSNYLHELVPSINRLDETTGYSFDNIELLSWGVHRKKAKGRGQKRVIQTTLEGNFLKEYVSCSEAARQLNIWNGATGISLVARGKKHSFKGFRFYYPDAHS